MMDVLLTQNNQSTVGEDQNRIRSIQDMETRAVA